MGVEFLDGVVILAAVLLLGGALCCLAWGLSAGVPARWRTRAPEDCWVLEGTVAVGTGGGLRVAVVDQLEAVARKDGAARVIVCVMIRPGQSANGNRYSEEVLRRSVQQWEGAPAFCDHPSAADNGRAGGRSVRDLVGVYSNVRYENGRGIVGELALLPGAEWLGSLVAASLEAGAAGRPAPRLGVSANMLLRRERRGEVWEVIEVVKVESADVVMNPSAGGRFERILEGESGMSAESGGAGGTSGAVAAGQTSTVVGAGAGVAVAVGLAEERLRVLQLAAAQAILEARLASSGLPGEAVSFVRGQFSGRVFDGAELERSVEGIRALLGARVAGAVVTGAGGVRVGGAARVRLNSRERLQVAMDRLFGIEPPDHLRDVPRLTGIREAYIAITGDRHFTGRYVPEESVLEANEVTTSVLDVALANSMTKRLVRDYKGQTRWWEPIVVQVPIKDMKVQDRILLYDFAVLDTVSENALYENLAWGDTKETYTPIKKGGLVCVTLEAIINDDVRAITRIPGKVAIAATTTINEAVSALFTANSGQGPAMTDTFNVFNAANHQSNLGSSALSITTLQAAMVVLAKMTNSASKRIGVVGKYLMVPPDLMYTAKVLAETPLLPGGANNDINPVAGQIVPVVVPNWTDTNNWYLLASPNQIECLEVGFLEGRSEPELLMQDNPTVGRVFNQDAITFKVRHIYGTGWLDYRGAYGAVVA